MSSVRTVDLSIVIVSWNAKSYIQECLESAQLYSASNPSELIVVDNASTDGSAELISTRFPQVKLIRNSSNLGFAKANNIGIALCSGRYVCLVNSDVKFVHDCFAPMLEYMRVHPDVAMIGPQMLDSDLHVRRSTMRFPTVWNSICRALSLDRVFRKSRIFGGQMVSDFDHSYTTDVEVLNGWFLMVRREALERVGLLDEQFFMYGEDIDWCYRFHRAAQRAVFLAEARAVHYGGASSANAPVRFQIEMYRANGQYWRKHHGRAAQLVYFLIMWVHQAVRLVGYFALLPARNKSDETVFKIKKAWACMAWMMRPTFTE
jgi:GT2 family glycosyltransferase